MSDRLTDYLERCLSEVPDSKYRLRLHQELEEHLADLAESFLARGFEEGEAALRAMEKLGSVERLREEYRKSWLRQPERWRRIKPPETGCGIMSWTRLGEFRQSRWCGPQDFWIPKSRCGRWPVRWMM